MKLITGSRQQMLLIGVIVISILITFPACSSDKKNEKQTQKESSDSMDVLPQTLAQFKFSTAMCEANVGHFDSTKIIRQQVSDAYDLWFMVWHIDGGLAHSVNEMYAIDTLQLDLNCQSLLETLKILDLPDIAFWDDRRKLQLQSSKAMCDLYMLTARSYNNPEVLLEYQTDDVLAIEYRNALIKGGAVLKKVWLEMDSTVSVVDGVVQIPNPDLREKYFSERSEDYARLEVTSYGWWNTLNPWDERLAEGCEEQFEMLFERVDSNLCASP